MHGCLKKCGWFAISENVARQRSVIKDKETETAIRVKGQESSFASSGRIELEGADRRPPQGMIACAFWHRPWCHLAQSRPIVCSEARLSVQSDKSPPPEPLEK